MNFDYNSTRPRLILAEYGRNVQNMVDYICTIPEKEERNRLAQVVIDMMGVLNPHLRDVADFKHKLWDHLRIISDFSIDVDSPYVTPTRDDVRPTPELLNYPQHRIKFKHYGFTVEKMIDKAIQVTDEEKRQQMALSIANFMKMAYTTWNKDSVSDEFILEDLAGLSEGILKLKEGVTLTKLDFKTPPPGNRIKGGAAPTPSNTQNRSNNTGHSHHKGPSNPRSNNTNNFSKRNTNSNTGGASNNNKRSYGPSNSNTNNNNYRKG